MKPFEVDFEADKKYFWCTCGLSANQPFCDGAHKQSDTGKKSLLIEPTESKTVWLCGCKNTKTPPYCDGSHKEGKGA